MTNRLNERNRDEILKIKSMREDGNVMMPRSRKIVEIRLNGRLEEKKKGKKWRERVASRKLRHRCRRGPDFLASHNDTLQSAQPTRQGLLVWSAESIRFLFGDNLQTEGLRT